MKSTVCTCVMVFALLLPLAHAEGLKPDRTNRPGKQAPVTPQSDSAGIPRQPSETAPRLRILIETDAGGAPDDEQGQDRPQVKTPQTLHLLLMVTDTGTPALTRYRRVILTIKPRP
ncbi:MAG: hypothetical protein JWN14_933 [Chthonomonadales bacterium]|nr:hypothetical protein [Chthonomonadales bacterium]